MGDGGGLGGAEREQRWDLNIPRRKLGQSCLIRCAAMSSREFLW
jgi:hypothetical protein